MLSIKPYGSLLIHRGCLCDGHVIGLLVKVYGNLDKFSLSL